MSTMYKPQTNDIRFTSTTQEQIKIANKIIIPMDIYLSWEDNRILLVPKEGYELPSGVEIKS